MSSLRWGRQDSRLAEEIPICVTDREKMSLGLINQFQRLGQKGNAEPKGQLIILKGIW